MSLFNMTTKIKIYFCFLIFLRLSKGSLDSWMSLGLHSSKSTGNEALLLGATMPLCQQISGLSNGQKKLCMLYTDHMMHVGRGARKGISECQYQFRHRKWNCSTVDDTTVFGPIISIASREAAFANAIASAGVVHSVSRGCRDGHLNSCGCSSSKRPVGLDEEWLWGGCGDNIHYGYQFAKDFIDIRERDPAQSTTVDVETMGRKLMNIHNNEAGRRAVIKSIKVTCKCHGVSGSCSLVTCWQQLSPFRKVGDFLVEKYKSATRVRVAKNGRLRIRKKKDHLPTAQDLIYVSKSPNYCTSNETIGTSGTHGRRCIEGNRGANNCSKLCCGRGYSKISTQVKEKCNCKFHWCCYVDCETCHKTVNLSICN